MQGTTSIAAARAADQRQRAQAASFRITHFVLPLAAFVALLFLFSSTSLDLSLAHAWAYDEALQRWVGRGRWWADVLLHRDGRDAILLVLLGLLGTLATGFVSTRARAARGTVIYLLVTIALGWGLVGVLKQATNIACPWDLQGFGGERPHVALFDARPAGLERAACFPGAHSGSGFSLFAFYFAFRDRRRRVARIALWVALGTGAVFAFGQEARGAHFLSHDLCSAFLVWFVALATYTVWWSRTSWLLRSRDPLLALRREPIALDSGRVLVDHSRLSALVTSSMLAGREAQEWLDEPGALRLVRRSGHALEADRLPRGGVVRGPLVRPDDRVSETP